LLNALAVRPASDDSWSAAHEIMGLAREHITLRSRFQDYGAGAGPFEMLAGLREKAISWQSMGPEEQDIELTNVQDDAATQGCYIEFVLDSIEEIKAQEGEAAEERKAFYNRLRAECRDLSTRTYSTL